MATNLSKKRGREEEERRKEVEKRSNKCLVDEEAQRKHVVPEEVKEYNRKSTRCEVCGYEKGESGNWVQCDACDAWYHVECVEMTKEEAEAFPYFCINCEIDVLGVDYIKPQV